MNRLYLPLLMLVIFSCKQNNPDAYEKHQSTVTIDRFEQELFALDVYNFEEGIRELQDKYPVFFPLYTSKIIEIGTPQSKGFSSRLKAFVTDFTMYKVSKHVMGIFSDMNIYQQELASAFTVYASKFPNRSVPRIITCLSGFNQSVITSDSILAISLDKYLGEDDEFYKLLHPPVAAYMKKRMVPEKIVPDAMLAWVITEFEYNNQPDNVLSQMIFHGRAIYCVKQLLPNISDSLLWGFSESQMQFVRQNEKQIWEYLVENKKLFVTDAFTISQLIAEAPFTKDFSRESPGKTAVWIGYRIVNSYMKRNKELALEDLMMKTDYQEILNNSRYNP